MTQEGGPGCQDLRVEHMPPAGDLAGDLKQAQHKGSTLSSEA
eukprot:CAMPEP_0177757472 /NCGR_PEP_ID=MMETSP0491_2-20121128/3658_1 /TAXON_ID=63592 /ORGANISM="Tetraselmis chuii, Strain PLY429" /LENGTH=41 /DNA_ID= /DNA_START= /DNA_END= /DNA_ORIENTATION=